eukprot:8395419-Pyramimonas_sp.AAC.1
MIIFRTGSLLSAARECRSRSFCNIATARVLFEAGLSPQRCARWPPFETSSSRTTAAEHVFNSSTDGGLPLKEWSPRRKPHRLPWLTAISASSCRSCTGLLLDTLLNVLALPCR